jgi:hypothetical protein
MSSWSKLRKSFVHQGRLALAFAPATIAAARAWQRAQSGEPQTFHVGRTSVTVLHDNRHAGHAVAAFVGGALLGATAMLWTAKPSRLARPAQNARERIERLPHALRAAREAARAAFERALSGEAHQPAA